MSDAVGMSTKCFLEWLDRKRPLDSAPFRTGERLLICAPNVQIDPQALNPPIELKLKGVEP